MAGTTKVIQFTLRELLAVKYVLISLIYRLNDYPVKRYTDNKNVVLILVIKSNIYRVKLCKISTFVIHVPSTLTLNGFPGRRMKELIVGVKFITIMMGVFLIFFSTGWRSFGVHIARTGSPIIEIQSCQGIIQDIGILVLSQSILLSAIGHMKTITLVLQLLWFRGCYYM